MFLPLKKVNEQDATLVGVKAKNLSLLESEIHMPFSLVITSEAYKAFLTFNNLERKISDVFADATSPQELVDCFAKTAQLIELASFPPDVVAQLRECFELTTIDTGNLNKTALGQEESAIVVLKRSTDYTDTDITCPGIIYTKESFSDFLRAVKQCYLSAFTPSSVSLRKKKNIASFQMGVVVSRMPTLQTCLESKITFHKNTMQIKSYVGFPDKSGIVPKDTFSLTIDFLRIIDATIVEQSMVAVFDKVANQVAHRSYAPGGSAQTVPDQVILEIGRLTKKISSMLKTGDMQAEFIADKNNNVVCVDVSMLQTTTHPKEQEAMQQVAQTQADEKVVDENELPVLVEQLQGEQQLAQALQTFLAKHKFSKFGPSLQVVIRSLENEVTKETLTQALRMTLELINTED
jgi:phosphoenolpyruvate synthase/pyruvate phosphate dikinase